jgi:hypothetical protein
LIVNYTKPKAVGFLALSWSVRGSGPLNKGSGRCFLFNKKGGKR